MSFDWNTLPLVTTLSGKPCVAISACLHGAAVRYDGTDKLLPGLATFLQQDLELLPICPEVGAGMTTPRPPIQLVASTHKTTGGIKVLGRDDPTLDVTTAITNYAQHSVQEYADKICAYIFKSRSPSCGVNSTPLFSEQGEVIKQRSGIQAAAFQQHLPALVFREEQQLQTRDQCVQFIQMCRFSRYLIATGQTMTLAQLHQHYQPLIIQLPPDTQDTLEQMAENKLITDYQALLIQSMDQLTI